MGHGWAAAALAMVSACTGGSTGPVARQDSRGTISGQVSLSSIAGANDMTRVRVDIGRGEGGVAVDPATGAFEFSDLEPDAYNVIITYTGGLEDTSAGSAYRPYSARVALRAGASAALGVIPLELGSATVSGSFTHAGGEDLNGLVVRLLGDGAPKEIVSTDGTFSLADVQVGRYRIFASRQDVAGFCGAEVVVGADQVPVTVATQSLARLAVNVAPQDDGSVVEQGEDGWFLNGNGGGAVTLALTLPPGAEGRVVTGTSSPGAYSTNGVFTLSPLAENSELPVRVDVRDACGQIVSKSFTVVYDTEPPLPYVVPVAVQRGETNFIKVPTMLLVTDASDLLSEPLTYRLRQCEGPDGTGTCLPATLDQANWIPHVPATTITFGAADGPKSIEIQFRDRSLNTTDAEIHNVILDTVPPTFATQDAILVEGLVSGTVYDRLVTVTVTASDVHSPANMQIRLGIDATLVTAPWLAFTSGAPMLNVNLGTNNGQATLYVQLQDGAGNLTAVIPTALNVSNVSSITGTVRLPGRTSFEGATILLLGTGFSGSTDAAGTFTITDVPRGTYNLQVRATGYRSLTLYDVEVRPPEIRNFPDLELGRSGAKVAGVVQLQGRAQGNHAGAEVRLAVPGQNDLVAVSDASGRFELSVSPGTYGSIRASARNFGVATFPAPIPVAEDQTFDAGTLFVPAVANDADGIVVVEGDPGDMGGVSVTARGIPGSATDGVVVNDVTQPGGGGAWRLESLPFGDYDVTFARSVDPELEVITRRISVVLGNPTTVPVQTLRRRFVIIAAGADYTRTRGVTLTLSQSSDCASMEISNLSNFAAGANTISTQCASTYPNWQLENTQGQRTVYARFYSTSSPGVPGPVVSDTIIFDSVAALDPFNYSPTSSAAVPLVVGSVVTFTVTTNPREAGTMTISIPGYAQGIPLFDDATHGDATANDGIYRLDYTVDLPIDITNAVVRADFTDRAGNTATRNATSNVYISVPPLIYNVRVGVNTQTNLVTISWETNEDTTGVVDNGATPTPTSYASSTNFQRLHSVSFTVSGPAGTVYNYRVQATDRSGYRAATNVRTFTLLPDAPQFPAAMAGTDRIWFRWEGPGQRGIAGYNVYRAPQESGPYTKISGASPYTHEVNMFEDTTVTPGTTYWYQVETVDGSNNLSTRSAARSAVAGPAAGPTMIGGANAVLRKGTIDNPLGVYVWDERGSPYVISSDVLVEGDVLLVIGPQTQVQFSYDGTSATRRRLEVQGRLAVLGAPGTITMVNGQPVEGDDGLVTFDGNPALPNDDHWGGIMFLVDTTKPPPRGFIDMEYAAGTYQAGNVVFRARFKRGGFFSGGCARPTINDAFTVNGADNPGAFYFSRSQVADAQCGIASHANSIVVRDSTFTNIGAETGFYMEGRRLLAERVRSTGGSKGGDLRVSVPTTLGGVTIPLVDRWKYADCLLRDSVAEGANTFGFSLDDGCYGVDLTVRNTHATGTGLGAAAMYGLGAVSRSLLEDNDIHGQDILAFDVTARRARRHAFNLSSVYGSDIDDTGCTGACYSGGTYDFDVAGEKVQANIIRATTGNDRTNVMRIGNNGDVRYNHILVPTSLPQGVILGRADNAIFESNSMLGPITAGDVIYRVEGPRYSATDKMNTRNNYWGPAPTTEMAALPPNSNISFIVDQFEQPGSQGLREADYSGFKNNAYPLPHIDSPYWHEKFYAGQDVVLMGSSTDPNETIPAANHVWLTGTGAPLGTGLTLTLTGQPIGQHRVELVVTDSTGLQARIPVEFDVYPAP